MSRRKGRILAFQGVYSWDVSQAPLEDILKFSWLQNDAQTEEAASPNHEQKEEQIFASMIISGTIEHVSQIDELIKDFKLALSQK